MRILSFHILKWTDSTAHMIHSTYELTFISFFKRPFVKESLNFGARTAVTRMKPGERSFLEDKQENDFKSYIDIQKNGLATVIVSDKQYPKEAILLISREIADEFRKVCPDKEFENIASDVKWDVPALEGLIKKYQDPKEADKLLKVRSELEEISEIMTKNFGDILKRGETLDSLIIKSKDVSTLSRNFYQKSREANKKCCSLY